MRRVKQFLLVITAASLFFITGCTTMQNIPYDDVYYSTAKGAPKDLPTQNTNTTTTVQPAHYKIVKVEAVNTQGQNTTSSVNPKQEGYQIDTLRIDTLRTSNIDSVAYSNINTGLGFDNSNFGTGFSSWSLGGYAGTFGFNTYWYDPSWYSYYYPYSYPYYGWNWSGNPYYNWYPYSYGGWGMYSYGYPYWGYGYNYYPYYGYYGYSGYPYYYNYYSPYHYWHRNRYYGHRGSRFSGSRVSFSGGGSVPLVGTKSVRATGMKPSGIRTTRVSKGAATKTNVRPVGSMRYQKALRNTKAAQVENNTTRLQKPVYRSGNRAIPQRQMQRPVYRRPANVNTTPRYRKPKQYQSLDTRQARSSTEYFRPQPQTVIRGKTIRVNTTRRTQRFNIYRPTNNRSNYRRPVYRNSWNRTSRSTPVRRQYNNSNRNQRRFYTPSNFNRGNNNSNRVQYRAAPVRVPTGGGSGGGGNRGGGNRGGGGGNIRR